MVDQQGRTTRTFNRGFWLGIAFALLSVTAAAQMITPEGIFTQRIATLNGTLNGSENEAPEGYFGINDDLMIAVRKGSRLHIWLLNRNKKEISVDFMVKE